MAAASKCAHEWFNTLNASSLNFNSSFASSLIGLDASYGASLTNAKIVFLARLGEIEAAISNALIPSLNSLTLPSKKVIFIIYLLKYKKVLKNRLLKD